eukprot:TRINITY_DN2481_c0_g1_i5.p3 TRINITY_DN2481_c0_g1~~TRINITY_DN2481_c0_g1_i5.p3  ORF type:complete len:136 (+),score=14.85 TRINITY_DN2481_c0_g1_i5:181-588(+)
MCIRDSINAEYMGHKKNRSGQCYSNHTNKGIQLSEVASGSAKAPGSIQVIERMMSLLDALAASPDAASLKQLAQATELHPSTAHRILAAMCNARFVERQDAGTYRLGIRLKNKKRKIKGTEKKNRGQQSCCTKRF